MDREARKIMKELEAWQRGQKMRQRRHEPLAESLHKPSVKPDTTEMKENIKRLLDSRFSFENARKCFVGAAGVLDKADSAEETQVRARLIAETISLFPSYVVHSESGKSSLALDSALIQLGSEIGKLKGKNLSSYRPRLNEHKSRLLSGTACVTVGSHYQRPSLGDAWVRVEEGKEVSVYSNSFFLRLELKKKLSMLRLGIYAVVIAGASVIAYGLASNGCSSTMSNPQEPQQINSSD